MREVKPPPPPKQSRTFGEITVTFFQLYKPNGPTWGLPWIWTSPDADFAVGPFPTLYEAEKSRSDDTGARGAADGRKF
jgi:hypothetical protein